MHTPRSAARAAGVTKATIYRAIRSGQLPACKLRGGNYAIYPAELRRAFPSAARGAAFAISQAVYAAAGVEPPPGETIMVASASAAAAIPTVLSAASPALPAPAALGREPRAAL